MRTAGWIFIGWLIGQFIHFHHDPDSDYKKLKSSDIEILMMLEKDGDPVLRMLAKHRLDYIKSTL